MPDLDEGTVDAAAAAIAAGGYEGLEPVDGASEWDQFVAVIRRDETEFNALVDSAVAAAGGPGPALLSLVESCVADYDWSLWMELWGLALRDEAARELRRDLDGPFRDRIRRVLDEGRSSGEFDFEDLEETTLAIASLIDALAVEATLGDDTVSPNFMFRAVAASSSRLLKADLRPGRTPGDA